MESRDEPIPLRLQELFTWRLKAPLVDLRVAQAAATVGPAFDADVVSAVIGDPATVAGQTGGAGERGGHRAGRSAAPASTGSGTP